MESRQLTPTLTDRQLIKKIARHFGREIQLAVITRGITTIPNFESLIVEYTQIHPRNNREQNYEATNGGGNSNRESESYPNKGTGVQKRTWGDKPTARTQRHRAGERQHINTIEFTNKGASTSGNEPKMERHEEKKKSTNAVSKIAVKSDICQTNDVNVILPDLRNDLLCNDDEEIVQRILKCPEVIIKFNNGITVPALIDTGSVINGLSESWFNQNKQNIAPYEILPMTNTLIISAVGNKSKLIRKQILCDIDIDGIKNECVFLVIPDLIKPCILGISFLQEAGCLIDMGKRVIELKGKAD